MLYRNAHSTSIDGVAPGKTGEFNPSVVKGLIEAKLLVPVASEGEGRLDEGERDSLRAQFDAAWAEREREHADALAAKDARITELEVELAQARLDLEAATTSEKDSKPAKAKA